MQQVVSAWVGTTASGRERNSGWSCCSTEAKKLLRSMWRKAKRSGWGAEGMGGVNPYLKIEMWGTRRGGGGNYIRFLFAGGRGKSQITESTEAERERRECRGKGKRKCGGLSTPRSLRSGAVEMTLPNYLFGGDYLLGGAAARKA